MLTGGLDDPAGTRVDYSGNTARLSVKCVLDGHLGVESPVDSTMVQMIRQMRAIFMAGSADSNALDGTERIREACRVSTQRTDGECIFIYWGFVAHSWAALRYWQESWATQLPVPIRAFIRP